MSLLLLFAGVGVHGSISGGGRRYYKPSELEKELKERQPFSRKRFEELVEAQEAQEAATRRTEALKGKQKRALAAAARAAEEANKVATEANRDELVGMADALRAAARAEKTAGIVREANIARSVALAIIAQAEDEEEAEMLLLH